MRRQMQGPPATRDALDHRLTELLQLCAPNPELYVSVVEVLEARDAELDWADRELDERRAELERLEEERAHSAAELAVMMSEMSEPEQVPGCGYASHGADCVCRRPGKRPVSRRDVVYRWLEDRTLEEVSVQSGMKMSRQLPGG